MNHSPVSPSTVMLSANSRASPSRACSKCGGAIRTRSTCSVSSNAPDYTAPTQQPQRVTHPGTPLHWARQSLSQFEPEELLEVRLTSWQRPSPMPAHTTCADSSDKSALASRQLAAL